MSVAIITKFHGPTNYRGARITASVPSEDAFYAEAFTDVCDAYETAFSDAVEAELYRVARLQTASV